MPGLARSEPLYRQLANAIRDRILTGHYPHGALLPSEAELSTEYEVSRPTVRQALAALRTEGLLTVAMGKGSTVRNPDAVPVREVNRDAAHAAGYQPAGRPHHARIEADQQTARRLDIPEGEPCFVETRTGAHPVTGSAAIYRRVLPFSAAEETPLETEPNPTRAELLAILTDAHGELVYTDHVSARMPTPDEITTLGTLDGTPVLNTTTLASTTDGRPLLAETITTSAEGVSLAYDLH
jgi:GntR family transcriptional regulator